jgi:hypothetical protein
MRLQTVDSFCHLGPVSIFLGRSCDEGRLLWRRRARKIERYRGRFADNKDNRLILPAIKELK